MVSILSLQWVIQIQRFQMYRRYLVFSRMGSRADSRHPLKPLFANFYCVTLTTIMVVNTGGASPSPAHSCTVWEILIGVPNRWHECGHEPTFTGFYGIHRALAESQNDFVLFLLKLGHDKLRKCMCNIVCHGHHGHKG
jgi:hypothetical protein